MTFICLPWSRWEWYFGNAYTSPHFFCCQENGLHLPRRSLFQENAVVAGLMAEGETLVGGCPYIYRGYENICRDFRELGARIASV